MSEGDNQHLQMEYEQVNENLRHYSNMRFAQMTLFAAIKPVFGLLGMISIHLRSSWE